MGSFNLSALAVRERAITLFFIFASAFAGIYAYLQLGRAEDPSFTVKVLTVSAVWPGATAQEMQDLVAEPLEKRLQELRWYDRVETTTRPGLALMTLQLLDKTPPKEVADQFYQARKKLGDEVRKLPQGAIGPFVNDEYSDVSFALYSVEAPGFPLRKLTRVAEDLRQQFLHVPGVKKVDIVGEQQERIFVEFSYRRLTTLGISPADIFSALTRQNAVTPAGSVDTDGAQVFVRLDGAYTDIDTIRNTPIVAGQQSFKLSDIANVTRGYEDPATFVIRHNGESSLLLSVVMKEGWNGLDLGKALQEESARISSSLPLGVSLKKITDQAINISSAVNEFMVKFAMAVAVVMLVSLLSLGWRVGMVVVAAIPLTLGTVFVIMMITDRAFDRITLGALIISLGLLVDDAIIAIESMVVKMEEGMDRIQAAAYAWSHTAGPMLAGTLVTVVGFLPVGFARSTAGEYAGNVFWIVGFSLIVSWVVAVVFTPYMGVKLLPDIKPIEGGHAGIYSTPGYRRLRRFVTWCVRRKYLVAGVTVAAFLMAGGGMAVVKKQFFPNSDRPELLVEVQLPLGTSIETTSAAARKIELWLSEQPESEIVTSYIGAGAPRFFFSYNPELPDPSFAKIVVLTQNAEARDKLKLRLRQAAADGLASEARIRATQLVFGPYSPFPVAFRVMGPDAARLREIGSSVEEIMRHDPDMRTVNVDWGQRSPTLHFVLDQERLQLIGLSPAEAAQQLQFLLNGQTITQVRENIRAVSLVVRSAGPERLDSAKLEDFALTNRNGKPIPLSQIGRVEIQPEDPLIKRRDRIPTITARGDNVEGSQPPDVSSRIWGKLSALRASLPENYRIEMAGSIEEASKANSALAPLFPVMILFMLAIIIIQVRSFSAMWMVMLTGPLGLIGAVPALLIFQQPFGFNAILGLIGLSGILMRNTLILIGQIHACQEEGLDLHHAIIEATVQRSRPVILTALAAVLAFIPLTHSVFWGSMAYVLIGGTAVGTVLTLAFLPALYAIWFRVRREKAPTTAT
ncbi:efflux RND transporter permease subunit [Verrucomicrobium sp. BvORR106]|uniref:efflux RND transporter permease subunit n=1 Tax=Verrucomicrobium sp. BvORR106 TaxID=1403819 RepID=UPI00056FFD95|nr:efflux RND transporter permease subunit [Verrucomicrobium sp. BvORR106]